MPEASDLTGLRFALYLWDVLAGDAMGPPDTNGFLGMTFAQTVAMAAEVDEVLDELTKSGATIVKPGPEVFWDGIRAPFSDQADHLWEVT